MVPGAAQRMCMYFSKLRKLTQQMVPAQDEKVKHSDLISTKKPFIHHAEKLVQAIVKI